jgi:exodeoxyribonuclease V beta subunit
MTGVLPTWTGTEPLPSAHTLLLEASAGTGKTWQIAHLVTRLVAEANLTIERILVITFTNDAAAELRDRVRLRLATARDVLADGAPPTTDALLAAWQTRADRAELRLRLAAACSAFDLAPISTIHGFSQRMLTQLAFESGQEAGLTLLTDVQPLRDEWVADQLALLYAGATEAQVGLAKDLGWTRGGLQALAKAVTGAVMPELLPRQTAAMTVLDALRTWQNAVDDLKRWLSAPSGRSAQDALRAEMESKTSRLDGRKIGKKHLGDYWHSLQAWLEKGAPRKDRVGSKATAWATAFTLETLRAAWKSPEPLEQFGATPLFAAFSALTATQEQLWAAPRVTAAQAARVHLEAELQRRGALTYDAMLSRLAERIAAEGPTGPLAQAIRKRFDAALVDEFQDTDAAQWTVLHAAFQAAQKPLLLIGDPKQAIYAFRGADVHVYMAAIASGGTATQRATMRQNWRSDPGYVAAMNAFWREGSDAFALATQDPPEAPGFDYVAVSAAKTGSGLRLTRLPEHADKPIAPFAIRWFDAGVQPDTPPGKIGPKGVGEDWAAQLCAREVCQLLASAQIQPDDAKPPRPLRAGDIAVLVRTGLQAWKVQRSLARVGVPAVAAGRRSVFESPAASWLLAWLDAVATPGRDGQARTLATTPLFGWTLRELDDALQAADPLVPQTTPTTRDWTAWMTDITRWAAHWPQQGFVRVWENALEHSQAIQRLLAGHEGERLATDLRHLTELCHAEERRLRLSPGGLARWLRSQAEQTAGDEQTQRLESDAAAVHVVTMHASKGLEYPVVLLPFAWAESGAGVRGENPVKFHANDGSVCLQLAPAHSDARKEAEVAHALEAKQEQRRLLYVALTRAKHHTVAWLAPAGDGGGNSTGTAFAALALRPLPGGDAQPLPTLRDPTKSSPPDEYATAVARWHERLDAQVTAAGGLLAWQVEPPLPLRPEVLGQAAEAATPLTARVWPAERTLATPWLVTSYSALSTGRTLEEAAPTGDWEPGEGSDTPPSQMLTAPEPAPRPPLDDDDVSTAPEPAQPTRTHAVALAALPGGTDVGKWVHELLEHLNFQTLIGDDAAPLTELAPQLAAKNGLAYTDAHKPLLAALPAFVATPLLPNGFCLRDLQPQDRKDELQFDLSLAGGADWQRGDACVQPAAIRAALAQRLAETTWDGHAWLRMVHDETQFPEMTGVLTGAIDLVLRVDGRYFIADYKTNKIVSQRNRQLCLRGHYAREWLAWDMARHGYHLQALFYTLALHRFLRERLAGYSYDAHIGGHLYLYLRGMEGPDALQPDGEAFGVYTDRWPKEVVLALDAALAGEVAP